MKKAFVLLAVCAMLTSPFVTNKVTAQDLPQNSVKTNIIGYVWGQYQLAYERGLNEKMSAQLSAGIISRAGTLSSKDKTSGYIFIPEFRYYFREAMRGFYAAGFVRIRSASYVLKDEGIDASGNAYNLSFTQDRFAAGAGVVCGFQVLESDVFVFDIFLGPQFKSANTTLTVADESQSASLEIPDWNPSPIGVRFGFNIGAAF